MKLNIIMIMVLVITSCAKSDMPFFEAPAAVSFNYTNGKSIKYSFLDTPNATSYNYSIPVKISGNSVDYERVVNVSVLADSTTATSSDYEILGGIIKANEFTGYVNVKLNNVEILKSKTLRLWLEIDNSKDFVKGNVENKWFELKYENRIAEPANWRYYGFGAYSTTVYKFMIKTLGVSYLEYGYPDDPNVPNLSYLEMNAYQSQMRTALKQYNKEHPDHPMKHEDGIKEKELVVIP